MTATDPKPTFGASPISLSADRRSPSENCGASEIGSNYELTRNPTGFAGALKKIGSAGSRIDSVHAGQASPMFLEKGLGKPLLGMMATHPPLAQRIRTIEPDWDGKFTPVGVANAAV